MIRQDLSSRRDVLRQSRTPFVHALVVYAQPPTSAKPGDEAIVLSDGTIEGFVGGDCAEATVRQQSLETLHSGETMLLRITPDVENDVVGKKVVHNPCLSGGTLEVFLEPLIPPPLVYVIGNTPVAESLVSLGSVVGYAMATYSGTIAKDAHALVVASHGKNEDEALVDALVEGVPYVGLVASKKRGADVVARLAIDEALKAKVRTPAGLPIGAYTAGEIALSILAEIVAERPSGVVGCYEGTRALTTEIDPVCGMEVVVSEASLHSVHPDPDQNGRLVWFCGNGCQRAFLADPTAFAGARGNH
ncbi:XdhC family protein [Ferrimicrobium acidiphilum]|uniref:XdhC and CoxI family protein n=1 Tax=Ferrimicrobium acidiphilum DSM 19497 TaxID=1121877 RepID=A0A0D8FVI5_9ACTN|nr:XdhC family protein [Ferrimicrobium acidiphilum]KJE77136.1 XdhC and CoxI family protein [Ferrimicrobium acidiphilum DSM 19497]